MLRGASRQSYAGHGLLINDLLLPFRIWVWCCTTHEGKGDQGVCIRVLHEALAQH